MLADAFAGMSVHNRSLFLAALGVLAFDAFLLTVVFRNLRGARRSRSWPRATATILSSRLDLSPIPRRFRYSAKTIPTYWPDIRYRYRAGGRDYEGAGIFAADRVEPIVESEARAFIARFPPGRVTECAFNPENPTESYLLPADLSIARAYFGFAVAATLLAILLGYLSLQPYPG